MTVRVQKPQLLNRRKLLVHPCIYGSVQLAPLLSGVVGGGVIVYFDGPSSFCFSLVHRNYDGRWKLMKLNASLFSLFADLSLCSTLLFENVKT